MLDRNFTGWMDFKLIEGFIHSFLCCPASSSEMASLALMSHQELQDDGGLAAVDTVDIPNARDGDSADTESRDGAISFEKGVTISSMMLFLLKKIPLFHLQSMRLQPYL